MAMDAEGFERFKVAMVERLIEGRHVLYRRTRNPTHALHAYRIARSARLDLPAWVLSLFDQWAGVLCVQQPKGAKAIADALGLGAKGGPSVTAQAVTQARDLEIAQRVFNLRERDPERDTTDIFLTVGEEYHLSSDRVQSIWYDITRGQFP
jgi:hypothetical protein